MLLSFPPLGRVEYDFHLGIEFGSGSTEGVHYKIILFANHAI